MLFTIVAYDIPDDKRRTRVAKCLEDYGRRVQYSVFEVELGEEDFGEMRVRLNEIIDPREDQLRYYYLCRACIERIEVEGEEDRGGWDDVIII